MNSSADAQTLTTQGSVNTESSTAWPVKLPPISPSSPFYPHESTSGGSNDGDDGMYYDDTYDVWLKKAGVEPSSSADSWTPSGKYSSADTSNADNVDTGKWLELIEEFLSKQYEFNQSSADKAMEFERQQIAEARKYNEDWLDNYYTRVVESMKKAGINPLLAMNQLGGVNIPSAGSASGVNASGSYGSPTSILSSMVTALNGNKQMVGNLLNGILKILGLLV